MNISTEVALDLQFLLLKRAKVCMSLLVIPVDHGSLFPQSNLISLTKRCCSIAWSHHFHICPATMLSLAGKTSSWWQLLFQLRIDIWTWTTRFFGSEHMYELLPLLIPWMDGCSHDSHRSTPVSPFLFKLIYKFTKLSQQHLLWPHADQYWLMEVEGPHHDNSSSTNVEEIEPGSKGYKLCSDSHQDSSLKNITTQIWTANRHFLWCWQRQGSLWTLH